MRAIENTVENARIVRAQIFLCDHGMWTSFLALEGAGWGQSFGGYNLHQGPWMALWVRGVCELLGVDDWSKVEGSLVRVRRAGFGCGTKILAIGHIVEDRWFDFDAVVKQARADQ